MPVLFLQRGFTQGKQGRVERDFGDVISSFFWPVARLATLGIMASGLSACAVGSMGAMVGGGADGVASLTETSSTQHTEVIPDHPRQAEFTAFADVIDTPVWASLGPLEEEGRGRFHFASMVGTLLTGAQDGEAAEPAAPTTDAQRYLRSLDNAFDTRGEVAMAVAVDIFRKNSEARRFIGAAREIVNAHPRPITAVNAAFQAGDIEPAAYRAELAVLDADQRVLSHVVSSLMDQRRTFTRVRTLLVAENPDVSVSRMDEELASLSQYEEMVMRLSATISGEVGTGS